MRQLKNACIAIYLFSAVVALTVVVGWLAGVESIAAHMEGLLAGISSLRLALAALLALVLVQIAWVNARALMGRPAPQAVNLNGNEDIQVSLAAVKSMARTAVTRVDDVMIENIQAAACARDLSGVHIRIEAIPLVNDGLESLARRVQLAVETACEQMLGCGGVTCQVRFLPAKTVIETREVQ